MKFNFPRLLLIEKNKEKFCQSKLNCEIGRILYNKYKINSRNTTNKIIKKRIYSFNSTLSRKLKDPKYYLTDHGYVYKNFEDTLRWAQLEKKHTKYREVEYKKYQEMKIFKDITESIGDIFFFHFGKPEKLNAIKVIEYESEYGTLKKSALVKRYGKIYNSEDFLTKKEVDKEFKKLIEKLKKKLNRIQNNHNQFKKKD